MSKAAGRKRAVAEDYESDDGFVEDAPKSKKNKVIKHSTSAPARAQTDDDGNQYWELTRLRRVQISEFKGVTMIGIREFYEKDGKSLPGKKGISLTLEQFNTVIQLLPEIEVILKDKGLDLLRPSYGSEAQSAGADAKVAEEHPRMESHRDTQSKPKGKANHEATSDEGEASDEDGD